MQVGTRSVVADNSGARRLKVIKVLRKSPLSRAKLKDPLVGSVLRINNRKKYKVFKGAISRAMVIRSAIIIKENQANSLDSKSLVFPCF